MMAHVRRVMSASTLTGDAVVNYEGEELGKIEEFMFDTVDGRLAYAVLSFGGFAGLGDKLFAVPWKALELDEEKHNFKLNVDKERLQEAPGFDKENWPDMSADTFATEIDKFYG